MVITTYIILKKIGFILKYSPIPPITPEKTLSTLERVNLLILISSLYSIAIYYQIICIIEILILNLFTSRSNYDNIYKYRTLGGKLMYNILSIIFKYIFIIIIYMFIFSIIRLIYLDIKGISKLKHGDGAYLKLVNKKESLPFKIDEDYVIQKELSLGRKSDNDIVIKDPFVSKIHFKIVENEGQCFLEDLKSSNGTFLNGEKLLDASRLSNGDRIRIGNIEFLFVNREQV